MSVTARAVAWVLLSNGLLSLVYASAKVMPDLISPTQILLVRYVSGFALVGGLVAWQGWHLIRGARWPLHLARAVLGCFGGGAIVLASARMPIVDATAIGLLSVVMAVPLGVWLLGERLSPRQVVMILVATLGAAVVMATRGAFQGMGPGYAVAAGIAGLGAALLAGEAILIRTLSQSDPLLCVLFQVNGFGIGLMLGPAVLTWQPVPGLVLVAAALLGPLAIAAQFCTLKGYRMADVSILAPVDYSWLGFAALIGWIGFAESPPPGVWLGVGLIAAGGLGLAHLPATDR